MVRRVLTGVVGLPLLVAVIHLGGIFLQCALMALSIVGLTEFYNAMLGKIPKPQPENGQSWRGRFFNFIRDLVGVNIVGYLITILYYIMIPRIGGSSSHFFVLITIIIISSLVIMVVFHSKINIIDCALTLFGFFYVSFMLSFVYLIRMHSYGSFFVWLVLISAFGSDSFAFFGGKAFGKRKLAPKLSPNKTVEGAISGVLGAMALVVLYRFIVGSDMFPESSSVTLSSALIGGVGAIFSIFGDLAASAVKRFTGIKDFGKVFPGHGGVLDRFDSVFFTAPMMYIVMIGLYGR
ncbi:MAG: phosphatidate cytidylyltransferase [Clostridiales bacterium]|jgi:phosphatidate cytidylyltransferase|nr:phosphatidate cytidylyltransferase [Clostridiales bacterium]